MIPTIKIRTEGKWTKYQLKKSSILASYGENKMILQIIGI